MPNIIFLLHLCKGDSLRIFTAEVWNASAIRNLQQIKLLKNSLRRPLGEEKAFVPMKGMELLLLRHKGTREIHLT